ncbi:DUF6318 family protein [Actinomyces culturomici]|uniref:DUF6318 family protein n=1 Tax=Actinomyces culturomici TaxID=1926276 RepID=UPI001358D8E4|nr:DUF6318 family protein [Actinomyces culturomici]
MTHRPARRRATLLMVCTAAVFGVAACSTDASLASGQSLPSTGSSQSARVRMSGGYVMNEDGTLQQPETNATVPKLNPAALQFTPEGAELAARHFVSVLEYSWLTGDTNAIATISDSSYEFCTSTISRIDNTYRNRGWISGLEYEVQDVLKAEDISAQFPDTFAVTLKVHASESTGYESSRLMQYPESNEILSLFIHWREGQWFASGGSAETSGS